MVIPQDLLTFCGYSNNTNKYRYLGLLPRIKWVRWIVFKLFIHE